MDISRGRERPFPSGRPLSSSASGFSAWALGHWGREAPSLGEGPPCTRQHASRYPADARCTPRL